ncbi:hypothetical protein HHI36_023943 [Cryptolaemus montrouzieri]|uniref:Uncharacterized protein n=1 Tax=Cryptolaemus montrouzieri TaxID=559131 RepID=A0ABD2N1Y6_9CUCU
MTNPSSRSIKFRLALGEYDFLVEYDRGKDNVTVEALSRIEISSSELKEMTSKIESSAYVVTRGRARKKLEQSKRDAEVAPKDAGLDHPGIVQLLKPPVDSVELRPVYEWKFQEIKSGENKKIECKRENI